MAPMDELRLKDSGESLLSMGVNSQGELLEADESLSGDGSCSSSASLSAREDEKRERLQTGTGVLGSLGVTAGTITSAQGAGDASRKSSSAVASSSSASATLLRTGDSDPNFLQKDKKRVSLDPEPPHISAFRVTEVAQGQVVEMAMQTSSNERFSSQVTQDS